MYVMGNTHGGAAQIRPAVKKHLKLEIVERVGEFPVTLRDTIEQLKEEDAESFLSIIEERLVDLLYGIKGNGLDCDRDTCEEIETAIRFFPQVLCERYWGTHPPIYAQLAYFKSVSFVPLLAKLGMELNQFQKEERGGLFYYQWNVLRSLVNNDCREWYDEYQQCLVDKKYVAAIQSLGESGIFRKQDISEQDLVWELSHNHTFPEHRFRCLVQYDPISFYNPNSSIYGIWLEPNNPRAFRTIFEIGVLHFPTQIGFLFYIDNSNPDHHNDGYTPFDRACREYGTETVTKIVGDTLVNRNQYYCRSNDKCSNMMEALVHAATTPTIHLDGVYFLLRRDPGRYCQAISRTCRCN